MWYLIHCNPLHFTIWIWVIIDQPSQGSIIKGGVNAEQNLNNHCQNIAQIKYSKMLSNNTYEYCVLYLNM